MNDAFVGIGSNLGMRTENCQRAIKELTKDNTVLIKQSSFYKTEPLGDCLRDPGTDHVFCLPCSAGGQGDLSPKHSRTVPGPNPDPWYINGVIQIKTPLTATKLLEKLQKIESEMGRVRTVKWGPRVIDLDLLFYNRSIMQSDFLTIPHPGIPERKFVLEPLLEIAPNYVHPTLKKTIRELLADLGCKRIVKKISSTYALKHLRT